jgi:hypothetical protein
VLTRPATKAGSFRLSPTRFEDETHTVENNGALTSEFLRIEIKTEAPNRNSLAGRFAPFTGDRKPGLSKIEFDNAQLRVTRLIPRAGEELKITAAPDGPTLIVVVKAFGDLKLGQTFWLAPAGSKEFAAIDTAQIELLQLDFKTKPQKK